MRVFATFLILFISFEVLPQVVTVVDEQQQPLPFFTLSIGTTNSVRIGDKYGKVTIDHQEEHCAYTIRYLGYEDRKFCLSDLKAEDNIIQLTPEVIEMAESEIKGYSDSELITQVKKQIEIMSDNVHIVKSFMSESNPNYQWESFGLLTLGGLKDRSKKNDRFHMGYMSFLAQISTLHLAPELELPIKSKMALASTFTQDLLLDILKSKHSKWDLAKLTQKDAEIFKIADLRADVHVHADGSIKKITINKQPFKSPEGTVYDLSGEISFIQDQDVAFFSNLEFKIYDEKEVTDISCVVHDFPKTVSLPEKYLNRSQKDGLFTSYGIYTRNPDYVYNPELFSRLLSSSGATFAFQKNRSLKLVQDSYTYPEKFKSNDAATKDYLEKNSAYIQETLKTLQSYDLAW
ncbi:hypothetical protein A3SI_10814 [Nitritalea halalkaliphila LW7]|uniref:Carboxypeptidase-like regulatory domain-containing protein n=1 Tax=Nitritalea halalkaliphila LW7 TaxID=1189621 RepID=I5C395_9BACT|nr:hypothetical protein [Nitritalea halalkaliphila]EIM76297.1 hypothetical protein A3SI_10814 [Nitritalea halalkaliphila LW7]